MSGKQEAMPGTREIKKDWQPMKLTVNKETSLYLLRAQRANAGRCGVESARIELRDPDPSPGKRWTKRRLDPATWGLGLPARQFDRVHVCVSGPNARLKSRYAANTIYHASIPAASFIAVNADISISCPELLFVEMAPTMSRAEHLLLGFELCGSFSRSAQDPIGGDAAMGVPPATSCEAISRYLDAAHLLAGTKAARKTLRMLADNAWSPAESVLAAMISLPLEAYGYGLGRCTLNPRIETPRHLAPAAGKASRVPDVMIGDTSVGINYDGGGHLDLDAIARAGTQLGLNPGTAQSERELDRQLRRVRAKAVDDIRRNRELSADGLTVFQVCKEDLYEHGGLDKVMMQVLTALELREGWDVSEKMAVLSSSFARRERQALLYSMLPGRRRVPPSDTHEAFVRI